MTSSVRSASAVTAASTGAPVWSLGRLLAGLDRSEEQGRIRRAALGAFAIRVVSAAIAYLTQVVLARWMGSFEYGVFVLVWVWVLILGGLSSAGLGVAVIRFVPEYAEQGDSRRLRGILRASRSIAAAIGTTVALGGLAGLALFSDRLDGHYVMPLYLAMVCLPIFAVTDVQDGIGRGKGWIDLALVPPYILRPLAILIAMVIAHELGLPMTATTAAGSAIVATWLTGLVQLALLERRLGREVPSGEARYETGLWFRTSAPIFVIYGCELVLQNVDVLALSRYATPSDVAVYFAALKTISLISFVHYAVGSAVAGRLAALKARGDPIALAAQVRDAAAWTFWPSLLAGALLLGAGGLLLGLFGPEFAAAYPVMLILVIGFLVKAAVGPAEFVLRMLGAERICAVVFAAAAVGDIALNIILVPRYGIYGAATANALSLTFLAIAFAVVASRRLGLSIGVWSRRPQAPHDPA